MAKNQLRRGTLEPCGTVPAAAEVCLLRATRNNWPRLVG